MEQTSSARLLPTTVWIDLDNSPHVPFFIPIIRELQALGHQIVLTARDESQVCTLADYHGLNYHKVGKHYGANKVLKLAGTLLRTAQLMPTVLKRKPSLSLSHGSRSLIILSTLLRIPTVLLFDYEHARRLPFFKPTLGIAPEAIDDPELATQFKFGLRTYQGLKEDVYVSSFRPDASILADLRLEESDIVATIRPPATAAHYHNPESEELLRHVVEFLAQTPGVRMVILPRYEKVQRDFVYKKWPDLCGEGRIIVPQRALDGLNLIWHSDLVVSGGGTMNREAAALGVPVYSIFRGKLGAVDRYLANKGKLTLIKTPDDVRSKLRPVKRTRVTTENLSERVALKQILAAIHELRQASELQR
jgi:predicted glycosyltransferase